MAGTIVWYLMLAIFGIALIDAVLMVVSPPNHRKFAAWHSRDPRILKSSSSNLRTRLVGVGTLLLFGLMVLAFYNPSVGRWPYWGLTFAVGCLGLGLAGIVKPTIFSSWAERFIQANPEAQRWTPEKIVRIQASIAVLGGAAILVIILWNRYGLPVTYPFGRPDFPLLLGGLLCLAGGVYTAARPERALTYLQKPVSPWVVKSIVALQVLTGVAMLLAFIQNENPRP